MKRKLLALASLLVCFVAVNAQTKLVEKVKKTGSGLVIPYEKYVLPNGLTLIIHEDHSDPVVHVDVTYHVGSAREEIGKSGFAHFFEHMLFQGSDNVADEEHFKIVTDAGGTLNGSTNLDRTNYYQTVPVNQLEKILWLEADRMGFFLDAVTQKKFEIQRSTVKNERGERYDNAPYGLLFETLSKNLFPYGHPYSWMTIGYLEDLDRVDVNDLKNFFLRWYGPNNAVLSIGGDVKPAEIVKLVEKYFGSIPRGPEVKPVVVPPVQLTSDRYVSYTDNYARLPALAMVFPTVPSYHKDMAALQCLAQVLGQGRNSLMFKQLVRTQQSIQASASAQFNELAGQFSFTVVPMQGKTLGQMDTLVRAVFDTFAVKGVSDDDIAKFKGGMESQQINGLQSVSGKVSQLAAFQTFTGNPNKISELIKMYESLTKEDVLRVFNQYIKNKNAVVLSVLPKGQEKLIAKENNYKIDSSKYDRPDYGYTGLKYNKSTDNFDRTKMPGAGPAPVVKVPAFWKKDLPNGIKMIGAENTEIPTVNITITIPGGHLLQATNPSKVGLASFFTDMMVEDTKDHTAEQLAVELQKLGSSVGIFSGTDEITYTVSSLKKNLDKTLAILEERMFKPKFTQDAFNRNQKLILEGIKQAKTQPAAVASDVIAKVNFGADHILAISQDGTEESVSKLTLQDIQDYYDNNMTTDGMKVIIVGDIKQAEVLPKLKFLNKLPKKKITIPTVKPNPKAFDKPRIYLVDVPKSAQTEFRIGYVTGLKYDATGEYFKANLMNYVLGGPALNTRMNLNLREGKGWTYGAGTNFNSDDYTGTFEFAAGIRADATDSALAEVLRELKEYSTAGITADEIVFLKNSRSQRDALRFETGAQKAGFIRNILEYNLPADYTTAQAKILKNMTKQEIDALAKKYSDPSKMNMLLVGDKAKILPGLTKMGFEIVELDADGKPVEKKGF